MNTTQIILFPCSMLSWSSHLYTKDWSTNFAKLWQSRP